MSDLLSGIDDSIFDSVPSPDPPRKRSTSVKSQQSPLRRLYKTPTKSKLKRCAASPLKSFSETTSGHNEDLAQLLEGAADWDWDDMNADFLTPKKNASPKRRVRCARIGRVLC